MQKCAHKYLKNAKIGGRQGQGVGTEYPGTVGPSEIMIRD
jgi:hypothetical protein